MTMTNAKLTEMVLDHEKRINKLEGTDQPIEPPAPVPPVNPPIKPHDYKIDMSRSYHIDFPLAQAEIAILRFKFVGDKDKQSYVHFTAVQMGSGGCLAMVIPEYGYSNEKCMPEISQGIATDGKHTDWVVSKENYIYLHIANSGSPTTVRLKSNGENLY